MAIDLHGKPIVITGASSGIGRELAIQCARAGMPVAVGARRLDRIQALVREIISLGGRAIAVACDVDKPADSVTLIDRCVEEFGSVYAVVANAGFGLEGGVLDVTDEQYHSIFRTNFFGTLALIRPGVASMQKHGAGVGHVIINSSCVSKMGIPNHSAYSASKAMQDHIGRALRVELDGTGIRVSTVHPIGVATEFSETTERHSGGVRKAVRTPESMKQTPEMVARLIVGCLRKPRGEVWTHTPTRLGMALLTAFPGLCDWYLARRQRKQGRTAHDRSARPLT